MLLRFTDNLIMQLTRDCNLNCKYCFQGDKRLWKNKTLSYEDYTRLVDTVIYERCVLGDKNNRIDFHFHGGEVTMLGSRELMRRMDYLIMRREFFNGIRIVLQTNGILVNEEFAKYCAENKIVIGLSFDGWDNDRMPRSQTEAMMARLKSYHDQYGTRYGLLSTVSIHNMKNWLKDCLDVSEWVESFGVNVVCTHQNNDYLIPSAEEQKKYIYMPVLESWLTPNLIKERDTLIAVEYMLQDIIFVTETVSNKTGCFSQYCGHLSNMIAVDPDLKLTGCDKYLEDGNFIDSVRKYYSMDKKDFLGMNQARDYFNYCKAITEARREYKCDSCPAECFCPGECQSYALSKHGKVTMPSREMCSLYRELYSWVSEHWPQIICNMTFTVQGKVLRIRNEARARLEQEGIRFILNENNTYKGERI